jgi:hypothetical protein
LVESPVTPLAVSLAESDIGIRISVESDELTALVSVEPPMAGFVLTEAESTPPVFELLFVQDITKKVNAAIMNKSLKDFIYCFGF